MTKEKAKANKPAASDKAMATAKKNLKAIAKKNGINPKPPVIVQAELKAAAEKAEKEAAAKARVIVVPEKPKAAKKDDSKQKAGTIKSLVTEIFTLRADVTNAELVAAVKGKFPESAFDGKHASWYRQQAMKGLLTGTPNEIPAQRQPKSGN